MLAAVQADVLAQKIPVGLSSSVESSLKRAADYMDRSSYDSAEYEISKAFSQTGAPVSETELYYLLAFEAENMYYNALFEQGLNSTMRALDIARRLRNDTLIGNAENLYGLFLMNMGRNNEAIDHFRLGLSLIPSDHTNSYLAFQYHAYGNLAECYLKLNMPDSVFYYAQLSMPEAARKKKDRGLAIANWNIAESWLIKNELDSAYKYALSGLNLVKDSPHRDIVQTCCITLMKVANGKNMPKEVYYWLEQGRIENDNSLNTDFSRVLFLEEATDMCGSLHDILLGAELLREWKELQKNLGEKQQTQRIAILKDYYEKNQRLVVADKLDDAQKKEIELRKRTNLALAVVVILLAFLLGGIFIFFRQRQRIAALHFNEEMRTKENEIELKSVANRIEAVYAERNRIASDLHDDIGASLSSIRIYSGAAVKKHSQDPEETLKLLEKINVSSSGMMERMSDIVWSINPKNDNMQSLVLRMKTYGSEFLSPIDINVDYDINPKAENMSINLLSRRNLYLIFKEAVNNIAKYSGCDKVVISVETSNGELILEISDNGKGFNVMEAQHGNGLVNMTNRTRALGGNIHISSHHGRGTTIKINLDIAKISDSIHPI